MRPKEGWSFWIVLLSAVAMLGLYFASTCRGQGIIYSIRGPDGIERFLDRDTYNASLARIRAAESRGPPARTRGALALEIAPDCATCGETMTPRSPIDNSRQCWNKKCPAYGVKVWYLKPKAMGWVHPNTVSQPPCTDELCPIPQAPRTDAHPAVCWIKCGTAIGSGTLIDVGGGHGLVVTAKHLQGQPPITCRFPDGRVMKGQWVADKNSNDLAAILIKDPGIKPAEVALQMPSKGAFASSAGYGGQDHYLANRGYITRVFGNQFELTGRARGGDSGGPVFDRQGKLIGVLWGTDGRTVVATTCVAADGFLKRAGRYLLPYRNGVDGRLDNLERNNIAPPAYRPPQDLSGVLGRLGEIDGRVRQNERDIQAGKTLLDGLAPKIPDLAAELKKVRGEASGALEEVKLGLPARIKAHLKERLVGFLGAFGGGWLPWLAIAGLGTYIYFDVRQRKKTGDKLGVEKVLGVASGLVDRMESLTAKTPTGIDDKLVGGLGRGVDFAEALATRIADRIAPKPPSSPPSPSGE